LEAWHLSNRLGGAKTEFVLCDEAYVAMHVIKAWGDSDVIIGDWEIWIAQVGNKATSHVDRPDKDTISFDKTTMRSLIDGRRDQAMYRLEPDRSPKEITLTDESTAGGARGAVNQGVYQFEGSVLHICWRMEGAGRPSLDTVGPNDIKLSMRKKKSKS
jgi:uncharacterized protein (TIGR03067 family)